MKRIILLCVAVLMVSAGQSQSRLLDKAKDVGKKAAVNAGKGEDKNGDVRLKTDKGAGATSSEAAQPEDESKNAKYMIPDMGITGPTHEKYVGKMVFAHEVMPRGKEDESKFITNYTLGEDLYYRYYLSKSIYNLLVSQNKLVSVEGLSDDIKIGWEIYLNGELAYEELEGQNVKVEKDVAETWTTVCNGLYYADGKSTNEMKRIFAGFLNNNKEKLIPGDYEITIKGYPYVRTSAGIAQFKDSKIAGSFKMKVPPVDPTDPRVCFPRPSMQDKEIEAALVAAYNKAYPGATDVFAIITSEDWFTVRNEYTGIITARAIDGTMVYKRDGKCHYEVVGFEQEHDGTAFSKKAHVANLGGLYDIPCDCIDKRKTP
jgi:hypothetical protein